MELVRVWSFGRKASGSSSEHAVTSISSGSLLERKVSGVPQGGQKLRVPCSDDRKLTGSPSVSWKPAGETLNHATKGAALVRRQIPQWQWVWCEGTSVTR
jgi:hypothetical protein